MSDNQSSSDGKVGSSMGMAKVVTDTFEITKMLNRAVGACSSASVQVRGASRRFDSKLADQGPIRDRIIIETNRRDDLTKEILEGEIDRLCTPECLILIFLKGDGLVGMNGRYLEGNSFHLTFSVPDRIFKIQRRSEVRCPISAGYDLHVELNSPEGRHLRVKKRLLDISASGLAFQILSSREALYYKVGTILQNVELVLQNQRCIFDLEVRNCVPINGTGPRSHGVKVGTRFARISPEDARFIAYYVQFQMLHQVS